MCRCCRYDFYFILGYVLEHGHPIHENIVNGNKLTSLTIGANRIKLRDSCLFFQKRLADLPKMFGFDSDPEETAKGWFPHSLASPETLYERWAGLPEKKHYHPIRMRTSDRNAFDEWYAAHQDEMFDFRAEAVKYCKQDVV